MILLKEEEYELVKEGEEYRVKCNSLDRLQCPDCGAKVKIRDTRRRILRDECVQNLRIYRVKCLKCKKIHSILPRQVWPYKQYSRSVIEKVLCFYKRIEVFGDCSMENSTIYRWRKLRKIS